MYQVIPNNRKNMLHTLEKPQQKRDIQSETHDVDTKNTCRNGQQQQQHTTPHIHQTHQQQQHPATPLTPKENMKNEREREK